jgi:hypothetical protein
VQKNQDSQTGADLAEWRNSRLVIKVGGDRVRGKKKEDGGVGGNGNDLSSFLIAMGRCCRDLS